MKKIMSFMIITLLLLSGCGNDSITTGDMYDQLPIDDSNTSQMVDDAYFLNGELKEIGEDSVLIDTEEAGLVWVSLEDGLAIALTVKSIVRVQFDGAIAESYPGQARGHSLEVIEPFLDNPVHSYEEMTADDMVIVDLKGKVVEGKLNPSSDTPTHLVLYNNFKDIGGVVHTHSSWATSFAQAGRDIPAFGTTQADYFFGSIPCSRKMTKDEIEGEYEKETGNVITETFKDLDPMDIPAVLINMHGPFTWGKDSKEAVHNAVVLEEVSKMAYRTIMLKKDIQEMDEDLLKKHFLRKHGKNAYYGQAKKGI